MVDYITREEKMELKLKEGVKVNSFTFKKEVEENVLAFFEKENFCIFLYNDLYVRRHG